MGLDPHSNRPRGGPNPDVKRTSQRSPEETNDAGEDGAGFFIYLLVLFSQDAADSPAELSVSGVRFVSLALSEFEAGPGVLVGVPEEYFNAPFCFVEGKVFEVGEFREVVVGRIYVGRSRQDGTDDSVDDFGVESVVDVFNFYRDVSLPCCGGRVDGGDGYVAVFFF